MKNRTRKKIIPGLLVVAVVVAGAMALDTSDADGRPLTCVPNCTPGVGTTRPAPTIAPPRTVTILPTRPAPSIAPPQGRAVVVKVVR